MQSRTTWDRDAPFGEVRRQGPAAWARGTLSVVSRSVWRAAARSTTMTGELTGGDDGMLFLSRPIREANS